MSTKLPSSLLPSLEATVKEDAELWAELTTSGLHQAGLLLNVRAAKPGEERFFEKDYWHAFLRELRELLCTESSKYRAVRQRLNEVEKATSGVIVLTIAGTISATLGIEQAVLVPFVALALFSIVKLSVNAWCAMNDDDFNNDLDKL